MSLDISNSQIAQELDLNISDVQKMTRQLRAAVCSKQPDVVLTDKYAIYSKMKEWGYGYKSVCHGAGEYVRDEDGDGFHEVHVNTMVGFWSLLRSWLRPHRGISQEMLPLYLGFLECLHNIRKRGKAALSGLLEVLFR